MELDVDTAAELLFVGPRSLVMDVKSLSSDQQGGRVSAGGVPFFLLGARMVTERE